MHTEVSVARAVSTQPDPLPVAVIGCGRMGRLHARVYSEMPWVRLVSVVDTNPDVASAVAGDFNCKGLTRAEDLPDDVRAVTIATPTAHHAAVAGPLLDRGIACLIEKPLARDVAEARAIVERGRRGGALVQVGHIERFNPAVRAMDRLGVQARFIEVSRISPLSFRSLDVGVVLDLMIHDIDIVLKLAQSPVSRIDAVGVNVIAQHEDICNARLEFENGCVANVTASRLALKTERRMRVFSADAYVSLDYQKRHGMVARKTGNLDAIRRTVEDIRAGRITDLSQLKYTDIVHVEELAIDDAEPLRMQLESFVTAIRDGSPPVVSAEDGLAAVEVATRIVETMRRQALD